MKKLSETKRLIIIGRSNKADNMKTIFRKVLTEKRLPDLKNEENIFAIRHDGMAIILMIDKFTIESEVKRICKYWLEEIELPNDEEICLKADLRCSPADSFHEKGFWIWGAKWLRDFVLAVTPNEVQK